MKPGRNDPCPCGSGKKYKNCCLRHEDVVNQETFFWHQLNRIAKEIPGKLLTFAEKQYGKDVLMQAWNEFMDSQDEDFSPDSPHMQVFFPWFFFDWLPNLVESGVQHEEIDLRSIAQVYLDKHGRQQDPLLVRYLEQCCAAPFSFYDILSVHPGNGFVLRDILTEKEVDVTEHSGSLNAQAGHILFARVVKLDNLAVLEGTSSFLFPPVEKRNILKLRQEIYDEFSEIEPDVLKDFDYEMLAIYHDIVNRLVNQVIPELQNTDGEPLIFHQLIYDIESPQAAFDALKQLYVIENADELLLDAEFNAAGELHSIEFPWHEKGNEKIKSWDNTILGYIKIKGHQLTAKVNSENRAQQLRQLIEKLLPGARYKTSVIESPQAMLAQTEKEGKTARTRQRQEEREELDNRPEVQTQIAEILREHYRQWPEQKLPVLNGKTPLQAIKTKDGREMVGALLRDFELSNQRANPPVDPSIFTELRERLRLKLND